MRHVLYIAFFFPPMGGAGVQRSLKFVRYLPEFGWRATVVTGRAAYWMRDASLLEESGSATVLRAPFWGARFLGGSAPPTQGTAGVRSRRRIGWLRTVSRFALVPDAYLPWLLPAGRVADAALREARDAGRPFDAILTTSSPDSAHILGRRLRRRTGLPWIADLRDPWTRRLSYAAPTPAHHALQQALERMCLREADRIVVTTEETRQDYLDRIPDLAPTKLLVIPNGYDEADFTAAIEWQERGGEPVRAPVLHAGQLNPERPIEPYLRGLAALRDRRPDLAHAAATLFLGGFYDSHLDAVHRAGLEGIVRLLPGRPHIESVAALLNARILLLLEHDSSRGGLILPGKVFEYLRSGRPILAVVPLAGAAARVVRELGAGIVADPAQPEAVARALERLLTDGQSRPVPVSRIEVFERRRLTGRLAAALDDLAAA